MSTTLNYRAVPVLGKRRPLPSFLIFCNGVIAGVGSPDNASLFTSLATLLATLTADVKLLNTAAGNAVGPTRSPVTIAERNTARIAVQRDIASMRLAVQQLGETSPAISADIALKAGFQVKKRPARVTAGFAVDHGVNSGEALTKIKSPGRDQIGRAHV